MSESKVGSCSSCNGPPFILEIDAERGKRGILKQINKIKTNPVRNIHKKDMGGPISNMIKTTISDDGEDFALLSKIGLEFTVSLM